MIDKIFQWAWRHGIDVEMTSKNYQMPYFEEMRIRPREEADFVNSYKFVAEHPVLVFSRGERHYRLEAQNWAKMIRMLQSVHKKIWMDLLCEPLELEEQA